MNAIEWIREFETYLTVVKNRSHHTVAGYVADTELLYRFAALGKLGKARRRYVLEESAFDWATFGEDQAADYVRALKESGAKDTSVARKVYALRQFFKFLRKKRVTTADPWADMELHAVKRKLPATLSINEMNRLLTHIRQPLPAFLGIPNEDAFLTIRDRAMLEVLYAAALRVSELCGMNWQDLNFAKREVTVTGKGNKERICPLGQYALEALMNYAPHYERKWEKKPEGPAPVFLSMWDRRIETRSIPRTIRKWCRQAGVKRVNPHAFRHSAATHMLERGADLRVIQRMLGHASIVTTEIYTHVATQKVKSVHANTHPRA
jgi:site-specific recombinase XerD